MGTLSLLQIVQQATGELGLPPPSTIIGNTNSDAIQYLALAKRCGMELMRIGEWSFLQSEFRIPINPGLATTCAITEGSTALGSFTSSISAVQPNTWAVAGPGITPTARVQAVTVVGGETIVTMTEPATATASPAPVTLAQDTYAVPEDYLKLINDTGWDRGRRWRMIGPISPQEDEWLRSGVVAQGPRRKFRVEGKNFIIRPAPYSTDPQDDLAFDYLSSWWRADSAGVPKADWTADTDTSLFDDDLMTLGLQWLFQQRKGLAYQELQQEWIGLAQTAFAHANPGRSLRMDGKNYDMFDGIAGDTMGIVIQVANNGSGSGYFTLDQSSLDGPDPLAS